MNFFQLYDRKMTVRLDKVPGLSPEEQAQLPSKLPEGLVSVGMGLGSNGNPLTEVAKNIASQQVCLSADFLQQIKFPFSCVGGWNTI
jgi:hypothetical protein